MAIPDDILQTLAPTPYDEARKLVRDGDILLCSAHDPFSRLIRWATKSPWSHVGIAFHISDIDRVMVLECVEKQGVRTVPLSTFISRTSSGVHPYPGKILLARHGGVDGRSATRRVREMAAFGFDRLGDRFSQGEALKIVLRIALSVFQVKLPKNLGPDDEYICSEFVARCFERIGLQFPWDGRGFVAPDDIAKDPKVIPIAQIRTR
jgi:hypothetical protein